MKYTEEELIKELKSDKFKKSLKTLEEISQAFTDSEPNNKRLLEARLLRANLNLTKETSDKLKKEDSKTIKNILIGAGLSFILTILTQLLFADNKQQAPTELQTLIIEQNKILIQSQIDYQKVSLDILSLKKEIDSLKGK